MESPNMEFPNMEVTI